MTSISATSALSSAQSARTAATTRPPAPPQDGAGGPLASVSDLLGTSAEDLATQLGTGKSLDDIATEKGVSHEDLVQALADGKPDDAPSLSTEQLERMASQAGGPRPPEPPAGAPALPGTSTNATTGVLTGSLSSRQQSVVDALADLLDTGSEDLLADLQGGADLAQMLQDKGITRSQASSSVGEGFLVDTTA